MLNKKIYLSIFFIVFILLFGCQKKSINWTTINPYKKTTFTNISKKDGRKLGDVVFKNIKLIAEGKAEQAYKETLSKDYAKEHTLSEFRNELKKLDIIDFDSFAFSQIYVPGKIIGSNSNNQVLVEYFLNDKRKTGVFYILNKEKSEWKIKSIYKF